MPTEIVCREIPYAVEERKRRRIYFDASMVADLFGRETRSVKRWITKSSFPQPFMVLKILSGRRTCRRLRLWKKADIDAWFGREVKKGEIYTTADLANYLGKHPKDIKRYLADGSCVPPTRVVVMKSRRGTQRSIRLWHVEDVKRYYDLNAEFLEDDGEDTLIATERTWTTGEARAAIHKALPQHRLAYLMNAGLVAVRRDALGKPTWTRDNIELAVKLLRERGWLPKSGGV